MIDKYKAEVMPKKRQEDTRGNSLSFENDGYYDSDAYVINPHQDDGLNYLVDNWNEKSLILLH